MTCDRGLATQKVTHAVVIISGGLDSTVLAYLLHRGGAKLTLLSFDYGQRHRTELTCAQRTAEALNAEHMWST